MRYEYDTIRVPHPDDYRVLMQRADSAGWEPVGGPFTRIRWEVDAPPICEIYQAMRRPLGKESA